MIPPGYFMFAYTLGNVTIQFANISENRGRCMSSPGEAIFVYLTPRLPHLKEIQCSTQFVLTETLFLFCAPEG